MKQENINSIFNSELLEKDIESLQDLMKNNSITSVKLTQFYLDRISKFDKNGPCLNSVIEINPDALEIAEKRDTERSNGTIRSALHGIPILIKDNIDTADKMATTAGSLALIDNKASEDAKIVTLLRDAGAVILGKTNMTEWANFRSMNATSGWSSRGGQTRNPYVLDHNPSGSSSGSAVAVSANLCSAAIGTETQGSIISPASSCGVVGIKPSVGLVSQKGIIPISKTQDTAGPITRTVKDSLIILDILTESKTNFSKSLKTINLKGLRLGVDKKHLKGHSETINNFQRNLDLLSNKGVELIEVELLVKFEDFFKDELMLLEFEFKEGVNSYLSAKNLKLKDLKDIINFNNHNKSQIMPYFGQEIFEETEYLPDINCQRYKELLNKILSSKDIIKKIFIDNNINLISGISISLPEKIDYKKGDNDCEFYFPTPFAMAGFPHITVPMGLINELPIGISFASTSEYESNLYNFAYTFEKISKNRALPKFIS